MTRVIAASILILFVVVPSYAVQYGSASFVSDGVRVLVVVTADTPWESPFTEAVNLTLSVAPQMSDVAQVDVSAVSISVNRYDSGRGAFILVTANSRAFTTPVTGYGYVNLTTSLILSGSTSGAECYFAVAVSGEYTNATHVVEFVSTSPDSLVGPFLISLGAGSPLFIVGLVMVGLFSAVVILGIKGVKRSRGPEPHKHRLDE